MTGPLIEVKIEEEEDPAQRMMRNERQWDEDRQTLLREHGVDSTPAPDSDLALPVDEEDRLGRILSVTQWMAGIQARAEDEENEDEAMANASLTPIPEEELEYDEFGNIKSEQHLSLLMTMVAWDFWVLRSSAVVFLPGLSPHLLFTTRPITRPSWRPNWTGTLRNCFKRITTKA